MKAAISDGLAAVQLAQRGKDFTQLETHSFRKSWAGKKRLAASHGEIANAVAFRLPDKPLVFIRPSSAVFFSICTRFCPKCLSRSDASGVNWQIDGDKTRHWLDGQRNTAALVSQRWNIYLITPIRVHSVWFLKRFKKCGCCFWLDGFSLSVLTLMRIHTYTHTCLKYRFPHFTLILEANSIHTYTYSHTTNLCGKKQKNSLVTDCSIHVILELSPAASLVFGEVLFYFKKNCLFSRIFGHVSHRSEWQLVKIDFRSIFNRRCTEADYQTWHLHNQVCVTSSAKGEKKKPVCIVFVFNPQNYQ